MSLDSHYRRQSFREIRPEASAWTVHRENAERQQAIDNFYRMNRRPSTWSTVGKAVWFLLRLGLFAAIAASFWWGLVEVLRSLIQGRV